MPARTSKTAPSNGPRVADRRASKCSVGMASRGGFGFLLGRVPFVTGFRVIGGLGMSSRKAKKVERASSRRRMVETARSACEVANART